MTYATTFSGIGGWELGLNACGWNLLWQCEREPFAAAVLRERFGVPICPDIRGLCKWVRRNKLPSPDALIGSPPCQPFSITGKKDGLADERHLYPSFIAAVRKLRPVYVLMEQVPNILSLDGGRAFGEYIRGLVTLRYNIVWHCIPACAVGAPHQRDRLWIVAHCPEKRANKGMEGLPEGKLCWKLGRIPWGDWAGWVDSTTPTTSHDGVPDWLDECEALGNAVVPQIPYLLGQAINEIEKHPNY